MSSKAFVASLLMFTAFDKHAMDFVSMSMTWHDHTTSLNDNKHSGD